jgi:hypothetical protein
MKIQSWQFRGKKDGVPIIQGGSDAPPQWGYYLLFSLAFGELLLALVYLTGILDPGPRNSPVGILASFLFAACLHGGIGLAFVRMRRRILNMVPQEQMTEWLGLEQAEIDTLVLEHGIRPAYIINGRPFYRKEDFDLGSLLRPSSAPENEAELLRPSHAEQEPEEQLLRASDATLEISHYLSQKEEETERQSLQNR